MPQLVECCLANTTPPVRDTLQASTCATVQARPCLQRCGHCRRGPFLILDGGFVSGGDHVALLGGRE